MTDILLGLALCSRPIFLLIFPFIIRMRGWKKGGISLFIAFALTLLSIHLGWSPSHIRPAYADATAVLIIAISAGSCLYIKDKAELILAHAVALTLPALYVSNAAYHVLLAAPFYAWAWESSCVPDTHR